MINISNNFKNAMKKPVKELDAYIRIDENNQITSSDDLISIKISCESGLCKTAMKKAECSYIGNHNLLDKWIHIGFGVRVEDGTFEYIDYGSFRVTEMTFDVEKNTTKIVAYDKMISTMVPYEELSVTFPISLYDYTNNICNACGLELENTSFEVNNNWQVTEDLYKNIDGVTYRDILVQIAQATASTCIIKSNDKIYFKYITDTEEELTYDNMLKLKLEPKYGEINSVVLGRDPVVGEDVFIKDDESIELNGLTEFRIVNNEILDDDRENAILGIYQKMHGIYYYPFDTTTEGLGWYEIGDKINIINDSEENFEATLFNYSITIDGGIREQLKAEAETKTQSQYQFASTVSKKIKNTEIKVNKQDGIITAVAIEQEEQTKKMAQIELNNEEINMTVATLNNQVTQLQTDTYTKTEIQQIVNGTGVDGVVVQTVISTAGTFDENGLTIEKTNAKTKGNFNETGMRIIDATGSSDETLLFAGFDEEIGETVVRTKNINVTKYLTIGKNSRIEDYEDGTGIFYVGGGF